MRFARMRGMQRPARSVAVMAPLAALTTLVSAYKTPLSDRDAWVSTSVAPGLTGNDQEGHRG